MISTYTVAEYTSDDTFVEVTYQNSEGFVHKRTINIPHLENGDIDQEYFAEILEGQLRGVNNKVAVGAITFTDPNEESSEPDPNPA
jgi:hypothetical protein